MIVHCPSCGRAHQASDALLGQRVRCTECSHIFVVQDDDAPSSSSAVPPASSSPAATTIAASPSPDAPASPVGPDAPAAPAEPAPATPHVAAPRAARPALSAVRGESPRGLAPAGPARLLRVARWMLLGGLVLVVLARGLETLTVRGAARLDAKAALEPAVFDETWADRIESATKNLREPDRGKQRKELTDKRDAERAELSETEWRDLKRAADHAAHRAQIRFYWLGWLFLLGALPLTAGLILVAALGAGPERVICLVMIGVITFSIFVGGTAWVTGFRTP